MFRRTLMLSVSCCILFMVMGSAALAQSAEDLFDDGKYQSAAKAYLADATNNPDAYLGAARSYTALEEWAQAIEAYQNYRDLSPNADVSRINEIIEILEQPDLDVFVQNLGEMVNSQYDEISPRVSPDGNRLYFFSDNLPGGQGGEDLWYAEKTTDGNWGTPQNMPYPINTESNEAIEIPNSDGSLMLLFGNYEGSFGDGDLFYSGRVGSQWTQPCNLGGGINTDYWEADAALSPDSKTIIFSSVEHRYTGGNPDVEWYDLYISHLRNGQWTRPQKLPSNINRPDSDQRGAFLGADGRTMYFASDGHPGLGSLDLFMTRRIGDGWDKWTEPVNLGKEINTVNRDNYITIPASGSTMYYSSQTTGEGDGFGGWDMFKMVLPPELRPEPVVAISGQTTNQDGETIAATLRWSDYDTGEDLGYVTSSPETGEYYITLPFGRRYLITVNQKGYLFQTEMLDAREVESDTVGFARRLGADGNRIKSMLNSIHNLEKQYMALINSAESNPEDQFSELDKLTSSLNTAYQQLNNTVKGAKLDWLEGSTGFREIRKDIQLTEASEGAKIVLRNIYFNTGSAELKPESRQELDRLFNVMENSRLIIEIAGHTDNVGSAENNRELSQARADSVRQYLLDQGIDAERITARGYGEEAPIATNETEEGRQQNRRVEVEITSNDYGREGSGELIAEAEEERINRDENLYELYRKAAIEGGTPSDAQCYDQTYASLRNDGDTSTDTDVATRPDPDESDTEPRRGLNDNTSGEVPNAMSNSNFQFITHSGGGAHGSSMLSGRGAAYISASENGEFSMKGYFMEDIVGAGLSYMHYFDIGKMAGGLPLFVDTGIDAYGVMNTETANIGGQSVDNVTAALGAVVPARLRYNIDLDFIRLSPYAGYNYNLAEHFGIEGKETAEEIITVSFPSWVEVGANAKISFVTAGLGYQMGENNSGLFLRLGVGI